MRAICPVCPRVVTDQGNHLSTGGLMTLDESIQGMRLQVIRRATQIGVSAACAEAGISRTLFYRWQHRLSQYGVDGLHPRRLRARPGRTPQLSAQVERRLLAVAIAEATWGAQRLAAYAQRLWRLRVAASTVQRLLRRHGLATRRQPLLVLEHHSARDAGLLTQRTRQVLWRLRHGQTRHVEAERPGELLCLDTFYIGKLKGVGKVGAHGWRWRIQSRVRRGLCGAGDPPHPDQAAARLDQRLRGALAA